MTGESYLGLVQWAVAAEADDDLRALAIQGSASQFHGQSFPGGSMSLETSAQWMVMIASQERRCAPLPMAFGLGRLHSLLSKASLHELDRRLTGGEVAWFREVLDSREREGAYWVQRDFSAGVPKVKARVQMITGWYDSFTPWQLEDFAALQHADRARQLIIGPWTHTAASGGGAPLSSRAAVAACAPDRGDGGPLAAGRRHRVCARSQPETKPQTHPSLVGTQANAPPLGSYPVLGPEPPLTVGVEPAALPT